MIKNKKTDEASSELKESTNSSLFDNPMVRSAMAAMSEEDKEKYRIIGEQLYDGVDFEKSQLSGNLPPPMMEAVAYTETQLKSGLHPSMMEEKEHRLMKEAYGDKWYTKWGYIEEDLKDIITLQPNLST